MRCNYCVCNKTLLFYILFNLIKTMAPERPFPGKVPCAFNYHFNLKTKVVSDPQTKCSRRKFTEIRLNTKYYKTV